MKCPKLRLTREQLISKLRELLGDDGSPMLTLFLYDKTDVEILQMLRKEIFKSLKNQGIEVTRVKRIHNPKRIFSFRQANGI
jgi:hypothetical protein